MAKVKVTHPNLKGDEAKKPPRRDPVPPGWYHAQIMNISEGATKGNNPLAKITAEFQILFGVDENGEGQDTTSKGRRVYQDFILEADPSMQDISEQRRYELRMLLDACNVEFDEDGFDTDDLQEKVVVIKVTHRKGDKTDEDGNQMIFTNVRRIDSAEKIDDEDVV